MNNTIIKDPNLEPFYISKDKYCYTVVELVTPTRTRGKSTKAKEPYEKSVGHFQHRNEPCQGHQSQRCHQPLRLN